MMIQLNKDRDWWKGAVIYQIYPRSFQDTTGDGTGDLPGITQRLDYVASLGVDAVWISPFFRSPMKDFGYDVSDYRDVDPTFGTMADFDALILRAHELGLKVMIDLVLSHTSDIHPWFVESRSSRDNPRADWYVWADPRPDGTAPNNWLSIFGGTAWQWDSRREQYYLHNFLTSQPDLNFHNPETQQALLDIAHFWLERGVDGFRLDTINFYTHDADLRSNPPLPPEERNDKTAPKVNPYNHQLHIYDKSRPENLPFLEKLRAVMDPYAAAGLGEIGDSQRGLELLGEYTSGERRIQMSYAFEFLSGHDLTAARIVEVFGQLAEKAPGGWPCWAFSNHDVVRHATRWGLSEPAVNAYVTVLMCLRGSVCIYQGEELGLHEADVPFEALRDPYGIEFWPEFKGRDGCRTPMVWEAHANISAGFTTGVPWLPIAHEHLAHAVAEQDRQLGSVLNHYRWAIALRHRHHALRRGEQRLHADGDVLTIERRDGEECVILRINLSDEEAGGLGPWHFELTEC